ncbi:MAG TPA: MFS transporter [Thermoplasmata archaeon]|nr:MFS transporter [Thermoplasmata archaeon]
MVNPKWVVLSNTTIGTLMASIDASIVLISLPTIGRELPGADPAILLWVMLSYSVVTTTLLLSFGRLSDMYGRVRLYTLGFAIFTIGSGFASVSATGPELLAARVVQGVGAAFLWSNSAALLTDAFPAGERGKALGINQVAALSGSVVGLVLGGILTTTLGWRSIFWVNLPIGTFGTVWAYAQLREMHTPEKDVPIDWIGNIAFGGGLTLALVGLTIGALAGWTSPFVVGSLASGVALVALFVFAERRVPHPMFDLTLFRIRTFLAGNVASAFAALARGAFSFVMVFYLQGVLGDSALTAGILLLPLSIAFVISGPVSGWISDRRGARALGTAGLLVGALGFLVLLRFPADGPYTLLGGAMALLGLGQGMFAAPNRAEVMSSVPAGRRGIAAGIGTTVLNAGSLGSLALAFTVLAADVPRATLRAIFAGTSGGSVDAPAFMNGLHVLFAIGLALLLLAALANAMRGRESPATSSGLRFQRTRPTPKLSSMGVQDGTSPSK